MSTSTASIASTRCRNRPCQLSSTLDRPRGQPRDDPPLEENGDNDQRDADDRRSGEDLVPWLLLTRGKQADRDRDGALFGRGDESQRVEEFVPGEDENEDRGGGDARRRERQEDQSKCPERRAAVHPRGAVELVGDFAKERGEHPDGQWQGKSGVGQNQTRESIVQAEPSKREEERAQGGHGRKHRAGQHRPEEKPSTPELELGNRKGG